MINAAVHEAILSEDEERREEKRRSIIGRLAVLDQNGKPSLCLVRNVSPAGMQVKAFTTSLRPASVVVLAADEHPINASIVWLHSDNAGIQFDMPVPEDTLLRLQNLSPARRRSTPRISAVSVAALRIGRRTIQARLMDISCTGAKVITSRRLEPGCQLFLRLPDLTEMQAEVRWTATSEAGLVFDEAIEVAALAKWIDGRLRVAA